MILHVAAVALGVLLWSVSPWASAHGCEPDDKYLIGHYHGQCDEETELAQGHGEAKGADTYVGEFVKGKPGGRGVYTYENGAQLEGSFRNGKAHGRAVYITATGRRFEGEFVDGRLLALSRTECPTTPGPIVCTDRSN